MLLWGGGGWEEICFKTRKTTIGMEQPGQEWNNSCNCLHGTVGGFTRPLERVLDEFLKFYITLQVTATLATQARIKYTEACIDSPVLSAWKCCDSVSQPLTVRNNRVNPRLCRKIKRKKWKKSIRVDSSRNRRSFLRFSADLRFFLEKCYIMLHRISLTLKYKNEYILYLRFYYIWNDSHSRNLREF